MKLSAGVLGMSIQCDVVKSEFCCATKVELGIGHERLRLSHERPRFKGGDGGGGKGSCRV